ncbi:MAG: ATPase, T2SS/T4P/T4SS family, partial [Candidatus Margulisiibacteriota bacterium]
IGEIRDQETAQIAVRAALTGHLVLATLHTKSCAGTIIRLLDMGIPAYLAAGAIQGIVSQQLVRKPDGGRKGVFEIMEVGEEVQQLIRSGASEKELERANAKAP